MQPSPQLVSVIIPCFNQGAYLREAIESVLAQTYTPIELIVVDDGSTDSTPGVIRSFLDVVSVRQENRGLAMARNEGLQRARGAFVMFLDSDDRLEKRAVERLAFELSSRPESGFVTGLCRYIDQAGAPLPRSQKPVVAGPGNVATLTECRIWMMGTVLFHRAVLKSVGQFDPQIDQTADFDLYHRIARRFPVYELAETVGFYRRHSNNMSSDAGHMLRGIREVLDRHRKATRGAESDFLSWTKGLEDTLQDYGRNVTARMDVSLLERSYLQAARYGWRLLRDYPSGLMARVRAVNSNRLVFTVGADDPVVVPGLARTGMGSPVLVTLHPAFTHPGEGFNIQPDGSSAIAVECRGATPGTAIVFGRRRLETRYCGDALLTATVPAELFQQPGRHDVYLRRLW